MQHIKTAVSIPVVLEAPQGSAVSKRGQVFRTEAVLTLSLAVRTLEPHRPQYIIQAYVLHKPMLSEELISFLNTPSKSSWFN